MPDFVVPGAHSRRLASLPTNYDLRSAYPKCWSIGFIRDQGACGCCWSIAGNAVLSDNYCIQYQKKSVFKQRQFSYEDTLENCSYADCYTGPNKGCDGGIMTGAFAFAKNVGTVTGENYGNFTSCKPSLIDPAAKTAKTPPPNTKCNPNSSGYAVSYASDKFKIKSYYKVAATSTASAEQSAMDAIITCGSLIASFDVYYDFYFYKSGVYKSNMLKPQGSHAVRVIGWGVESPSGVKYWLVANSWGTDWGIAGFFKMIRGINHCDFEKIFFVPVVA